MNQYEMDEYHRMIERQLKEQENAQKVDQTKKIEQPDTTRLEELREKAQRTGRNLDISAFQREKRRLAGVTPTTEKLAELRKVEAECLSRIERAQITGNQTHLRDATEKLNQTQWRICQILDTENGSHSKD
jgi:uncharacterized membrane protein (DUF106 family)